jgi:hypothetical protein
MNDLHELWALIRADLARAYQTLPESAECDQAFCQYREFIDHNELELACDMLASYGEQHSVVSDLWLALRDAAVKMQLSDHARAYEQRISG